MYILWIISGFDEKSEEGSSRDFMLKKDDNPGYLRPDTSKGRHDVEIDHLPEDFGKFNDGPMNEQPKTRPNFEGFTKTYSFGQSFSSSSVRLPG